VSARETRPLAPRQAEVRDFIAAFNKEHGFSPTMKEIGERFKITAPAAHHHVCGLAKRGAVELVRYPPSRRTLRYINVLPFPPEPST
jgi:SOS-response transcriptional repressor LexA